MKLPNFSPYALIAVAFSVSITTGCKDQQEKAQIPVDRKKAQEHIIPIEQAIQYTSRFRESRTMLYRSIAKDSFFAKNRFVLLNAEYFNRDAIAALLNQTGTDGGIRIYSGQDK